MAGLLSICVGHMGRSAVPFEGGFLRLFPRCVESLLTSIDQLDRAGIHPAVNMELVVADWPVPGEQPVENWLQPLVAGRLATVIVEPGGTYNRGRGRNEAARAAVGENLFFLDTDMLVPPAVFTRGFENLKRDKVFFPIYRRFTNVQEVRALAEHGTGNCFLSAAHFLESGGWPEQEAWGREDTDFWRYWQKRKLAVREPVDGFLHQWHPLARDHKNFRQPART